MDTEARERAGSYVAQRLSQRRRDGDWLQAETELNIDTITDFLNGKRWPRKATRHAIEDALGLDRGEIEAVARGRIVVQDQGDPIDAAIDASEVLTQAQKLRLRSYYADMLEGRDREVRGA